MKKTDNYSLPQWEKQDFIKMEDFNDAFSSIEQALTNMRTAAGTYTGNGAMMADGGQEIALGFKPKFVIITRGWLDPTFNPRGFYVTGEAAVEGQELYFQLTDNGFRVGGTTEALVDQVYNVNFPMELNTANLTYSYIAFH